MNLTSKSSELAYNFRLDSVNEMIMVNFLQFYVYFSDSID